MILRDQCKILHRIEGAFLKYRYSDPLRAVYKLIWYERCVTYYTTHTDREHILDEGFLYLELEDKNIIMTVKNF